MDGRNAGFVPNPYPLIQRIVEAADVREAVEDRARREIMLACWEQPGTSTEIKRRLNGMSEGNFTPKLKELLGLGALLPMQRPGARGTVHAFNDAHLDLLLDADRRASPGALRPRICLIVVPRPGVRRTWELIQSGRLVDRLCWLLEITGPALVLAVDERIEEARGASVVLELDGEDIPNDALEVRRIDAVEDLAERAAYYME